MLSCSQTVSRTHRARRGTLRNSPHRLRPCRHRSCHSSIHPKPTTTDTRWQIGNPSVAALYEDALVYETGSAITSTGALTAYSGTKTGRSPLDKRIVKEPSSENEVWWGPVNKPMTPDVSMSSIRTKHESCCRPEKLASIDVVGVVTMVVFAGSAYPTSRLACPHA